MEEAENVGSELGQILCDGDQGFVNAFNPNIKFSWGGRIMRGSARCIWIMEAPGASEIQREGSE